MLFNKRGCGCGMDPQMAMPMSMPMAGPAGGCGCGCNPCCECTPCCQMECPLEQVMDPPVERVVRREIIHNIQHIDPVNTRVINNHIFRHSYMPHYTCCEENTCCTECCPCNPCCNPCDNPCGYSGSNF